MNAAEQYRINQPAVISEVVDGEAVIVNLDSGAYFSLRDTGCVIWNLLIQGMAPSDVAKTVGDRYSEAGHVIDSAVRALVADLLSERLLVPANSPSTAQNLALPLGAENGARHGIARHSLSARLAAPGGRSRGCRCPRRNTPRLVPLRRRRCVW